MKNVLFVTGTDTGVGKTVVTACLALKIRQMGHSCGVLKPFASGCSWKDGVLRSEDADFLQHTLDLTDSHDQICPLRLEEPLAPLIAARRAAIDTRNWPQIARAALETLRLRYDWVIVEGAGGILAPLWENAGIGTNLDLINAWGLPTVLVARRSLGTLNHTLLTLGAPLQAPAHFTGVVFCDSVKVEREDIASQTSVAFLQEQIRVPIWGEVPFLSNREALGEVAARLEMTTKNRAMPEHRAV